MTGVQVAAKEVQWPTRHRRQERDHGPRKTVFVDIVSTLGTVGIAVTGATAASDALYRDICACGRACHRSASRFAAAALGANSVAAQPGSAPKPSRPDLRLRQPQQ